MTQSLIYTSAINDMLHRRIDFDADEFRIMLVGDRYKPDADRHRHRSDVSDEITGEGYESGGLRVDVAVVKDQGVDVLLGAAQWPDSSLQASGAVYFRSRGGNPANDELIAFIWFGGEIISTHGNWTITRSILRFQMSRIHAA